MYSIRFNVVLGYEPMHARKVLEFASLLWRLPSICTHVFCLIETIPDSNLLTPLGQPFSGSAPRPVAAPARLLVAVGPAWCGWPSWLIASPPALTNNTSTC